MGAQVLLDELGIDYQLTEVNLALASG